MTSVLNKIKLKFYLILFFYLLTIQPVFSDKSLSAEKVVDKIISEPLLFCARKNLPKSFFRHAKWAQPVDYGKSNLPKVHEYMSDEEFHELFPPIELSRAMDIYYIIGVTQMIFKEHNIKALPIGGTMLGLLRNKGQLPHDDDADFALTKKDLKKVKTLEGEFEKYNLALRTAFGFGMQVYPKGGKNSFKLASSAIWNMIPIKKLPKSELTKRGFIDLMPISFYEQENVYRYSALLAKEIWWQQTIPKDLFDSEYKEYSFGPLTMMAPKRDLAQDNILKVYPNSLDYAMQTVNHRRVNDNNSKYILVPLTEKQKLPYFLSEKNVAELKHRFLNVGLILNQYGQVQKASVCAPNHKKVYKNQKPNEITRL